MRSIYKLNKILEKVLFFCAAVQMVRFGPNFMKDVDDVVKNLAYSCILMHLKKPKIMGENFNSLPLFKFFTFCTVISARLQQIFNWYSKTMQ